ncbi:MAG TPA: gliding motility-associated ABC transporter substrate-binding protein GldG [Bacteroidales bacterium]|nr:gliding motility-associated ABC transporter substrate-binding protein GldG [Bacteroidales bacterium]
MAETKLTQSIRSRSWISFAVTAAAIIIAASALGFIRLRLDLTEDQRFTLSKPTKKILDGIKNDVFIQVYLDGDIPIPLKRMKRSVQDLLEEFRIASGKHIDYEFINPAETKDSKQRIEQFTSLENKGLNPIRLVAGDKEGGSSQKMIFPGMIVNYNGAEVPVNFLENNLSASTEQNILHSVEGLEYEMIQTIATITSDTVYKVAFLEGQGELREIEVADITMNLAKYFTVDRGSVGGKPGVLDKYSAVIVAGPVKEFSEADKLVVDQYIMNGGKVLWLYDEVSVNADSLINGETVGLYHPLNIEDQLFRYGARVNPVIVQDMECMIQRFSVMTGAEQKQIVPAPWVYYPLLTPSQHHPITRNLNKVLGRFVNTIDTVGLDPSIKKSVLLTTSNYSRTLLPPMVIRLKEAELTPDVREFTKSNLTVAVLLEGSFTSAFKNRMTANLVDDQGFKVRTSGTKTKMIVVADGDIIRNEVHRSGTSETPYRLGQDQYTGQMYGNRDFLVNCMNYLVDNNGLMDLRSREMKMRLLDKQEVTAKRTEWQLVNIIFPIAIVIIAGIVYNFFRKRKFATFG